VSYAEKTSVSADRSQAEIRNTLVRYGATHFAYGEGPGKAVIGFRAHGRSIRFELPLPIPGGDFRKTPSGRERSERAAAEAWEQETRRLWRALALAIKAKLEVVQSGIATFEEEFLAHVVLPDNRTVGEHVGPMIEEAYRGGKVRALLPEFAGEEGTRG
jgi:hypothetical protein